jgi:hypothetical protein
MPRRLLAIRLLPADDFARLLGALRQRYPDAEIVALSGDGDVPSADETIDWRARPRRQLLADLRGRAFDLAVVAHGRDQYAARAYWKAVALAAGSGAKARLICEEGDLDRAHGPAFGLWRAVVHIVQEICAAAIGLLVLIPVLLLTSLSDIVESVLECVAGPKPGQTKDTSNGTY